MMKRSIYVFLVTPALAMGIIIFSRIFLSNEIGSAELTEETISGNREATEGLVVGFRADSADDLHWINVYDYTRSSTVSSFTRGGMPQNRETAVYDAFRFTGWSTRSFCTLIQCEELSGLQDKEIQRFYDELQEQVSREGKEKRGSVSLKEYLDYYPVNFRFRFGETTYDSAAMMQALKDYEKRGELTEESIGPYQGDIELYKVLNDRFRIPVIDNEYQQYSISKHREKDKSDKDGDDEDNDPVIRTVIDKPLDGKKDYYEFDPVIVLQQENIKDGQNWQHPDTKKQSGADSTGSGIIGASEYGLKNRMLFVINNRTAKGEAVDMSQIKDGFGVYELPIDAAAGMTIGKGRKNLFVPDPKPLPDQLRMVYPLDEKAEYVEMSLSGDHRQLALFYVKDKDYFVEIADADTWEPRLTSKLFPAAQEMTYSWGDDGTLVITDHNDHIAILTTTGIDTRPYEVFYKGRVPGNLDRELFTADMIEKKNSYCRYKFGIDYGLAAAAGKDKVALVQNSPMGISGLRSPDLMCAVIDKTGVAYYGTLKNNITDIGHAAAEADYEEIRRLADGSPGRNIIKPVENENQAEWRK